MHRSSSISSSENLRYVVLLAFGVLAGLLACYSLVKTSLAFGGARLPYLQLFDYQVDKVGSEPVPETLFLGDSSLGNAISVARWQELRGERAQSLALTGAYGYVGSYGMLLRQLERGKPKNVVLMHTADMLSRDTDDELWLQAVSPKPREAWAWLVLEWRTTLNPQEVSRAWRGLLHGVCVAIRSCRERSGSKAVVVTDDYIQQGEKRVLQTDPAGLEPASLRPDKVKYLKEIVAICHEHKLNCVYAYGPLAEAVCSLSQTYLARSSELIRELGLSLATDGPLCIAKEEIGDALDHVAPASKASATERYMHRLRPFLR